MGVYWCLGPCIGCGRPFSFNPDRVPSISLAGRPREPICQACVDRVNPRRLANGLAPIVPLPGAYEPADEYAAPRDDDDGSAYE